VVTLLDFGNIDFRQGLKPSEAGCQEKRKINKIFTTLAREKDENVRYALMCNTSLSGDKLRQIRYT
jgi:hypothetical protein